MSFLKKFILATAMSVLPALNACTDRPPASAEERLDQADNASSAVDATDPTMSADEQSPVMLSYFLDPADPDALRLLFGEAKLMEDDSITFEAIWEIKSEGDTCPTPVSEDVIPYLALENIVMIGPPTSYEDAADLVTKVSARLYLIAGAHQVTLPESLVQCQGKFLSGYHAIGAAQK